MHFIKLSLISIASCLLIAVTGCANYGAESELYSDNGDLEQRIINYYEFEQNEKWEDCYKFRTPGYQKAIAVANYSATMKFDNTGWKLLRYEILSIESNRRFAKVRIKFHQSVPEDFIKDFGVGSKENEMSFTEVTEWALIDGNWYAKSAGVRAHLRMNALLFP